MSVAAKDNIAADDIQAEKQLKLWVKGKPIHVRIEGEQYCCPDYSCCNPVLLAPKPIRKLFVKAKEKENETIKNDLMKTFTMYFSQAMGYQYVGGGITLSYTDWIRGDWFGIIARIVIWWWMKRRGVVD